MMLDGPYCSIKRNYAILRSLPPKLETHDMPGFGWIFRSARLTFDIYNNQFDQQNTENMVMPEKYIIGKNSKLKILYKSPIMLKKGFKH